MSEQQLVVFCTPAFDYNVTCAYAQSMMETEWLLQKTAIHRAHMFVGGDPYLAKVRNLCVARALKQYPNLTDIFFIDADVTWNAQAVPRFLASDKDVIAGVYPKKSDNIEYPVFLKLKSPDEPEYIIKDGLYLANAVPTGFLRIKRRVIDKMNAQVGTYVDGTGGGEKCHNLFEMGYWPDDPKNPTGTGEWWGEDFAWSRRWTEMGGELWVDPDINFEHRGSKSWAGNFLRNGIEPSIKQGIARMPSPKPIIEAHEADFLMAAE